MTGMGWWFPRVMALTLGVQPGACGKLHREDVRNSSPAVDETTNAERDAALPASNSSAELRLSTANTSSPPATPSVVQPPLAELCPDVACPSRQCCVDGKACGTRLLVDDFRQRCLLEGDMDATLDETCPSHVCIDPRARCTFRGCRTTSGQCGIWINTYSYRAGDEGFTFSVNLGCIVLTNEP